jgi:hypothetical protein
LRTPQFASRLLDGVRGGDLGLVLELFEDAGVVLSQGRHAVAGLVGDVGEAAAFPRRGDTNDPLRRYTRRSPLTPAFLAADW